ncbi:rhodanese-like domain-containing protein [Alicyclobacillus fastidiosus]|uniref:Rhodanese-like domain-containing protein n=1 Tax=Alicyclobacillus fastidiosus TaxID=392011 RepID=A0ABY6ZMA4_9BACL|nr:rhodanese-like domain-containing protein [Alicyclobacillus fastidiosus]WAH44053.1 rhodanese-like domain-containing protein [Alicyclobacillus fastidiosus]GMA60340.1 hypothetical protein GCM10025859_07800 [Alicyclobacillus fastidiosus]
MNWIEVAIVVVVVGYLAYRMLPVKGVKSISPDEVQALLSKDKATVQFVDVREPGEFSTGHVPGFKNIPLSQLKSRLNEMNTERPVVLMCRSGSRSQQAARTLVKQGFTDVRNASGGIMAWKGRKEKVMG